MATKKESSKSKVIKSKTAKTKSLTRKPVSKLPKKNKPTNVKQEPQYETVLIDAKSLKTIRSLTNYLSLAVVLNTFLLIVQIWATFKAGFILSWVSFAYIFFSIILICALVWCIYLLKQWKVLALWVFIGFIAMNLISTLAFRLYGGKDLFLPLDIVTYLVQIAIFNDIYRLKRNGILDPY